MEIWKSSAQELYDIVVSGHSPSLFYMKERLRLKEEAASLDKKAREVK